MGNQWWMRLVVVLVIGLVLVTALAVGGSLWIGNYIDPTTAGARATVAQIRVNLIAALIQLLGGTLLAFTIYTALKNLELTREGQITDRFTKAIDQLGAVHNNGRPQLEVRLGGIYALERIARDSRSDHWPVIEILSSYLRENTAIIRETDRVEGTGEGANHPDHRYVGPSAEMGVPRCRSDIQATVIVLSRRNRTHDPDGLGLIDLFHSNLSWAATTGVKAADLSWALLNFTDLSHTIMLNINLSHTYLYKANLRHAGLSGAKFVGATLEGADLTNASLGDADLSGADLSGADLTGAQGVTQEQVDSTFMDEKTKLPPGIRRSTRERKPGESIGSQLVAQRSPPIQQGIEPERSRTTVIRPALRTATRRVRPRARRRLLRG